MPIIITLQRLYDTRRYKDLAGYTLYLEVPDASLEYLKPKGKGR